MNDTCGCCEGTSAQTPAPIGNRPGLDAIEYRVGTHGSFLSTMLARLSSAEHPALADLTTRVPSDPAIALCDAWAVVGDVLSFYQERIANEGYLRTADERRSVLELARLIGYRPRPGVSASTLLAFTIEPTVTDEVLIDAGTRAQSLPGPGQQPQPFETGESLKARSAWSAMRALGERGQARADLFGGGPDFEPLAPLYIKGVIGGLLPGMSILVDFGNPKQLYRVETVTPDQENQRTRLDLSLWITPPVQPAVRRMLVRGGGPMDLTPELNADGLKSMIDFLSAASGQDSDELKSMLVGTAISLRDALAALSAAAPSLTVDRAVRQSLAGLRDLRDTVREIRGQLRPITVLSRWLGEIEARLDNAIDDLTKHDFGPAGGAAVVPVKSGQIVANMLSRPPSGMSLRDPAYLNRSLSTVFAAGSSQIKQLQIALQPQLQPLQTALRNVVLTGDLDGDSFSIYLLRLRAPLFGHNVPRMVTYETVGGVARPETPDKWDEWPVDGNEATNKLYLDNAYEAVRPSDVGVVVVPGDDESTLEFFELTQATVQQRTAYGVSGKTTELLIAPELVAAGNFPERTMEYVRGAIVYTQAERLELALAPDDSPIAQGESTIELDTVYDFLETGRRLIIAGEDANQPPGVRASEATLLAGVEEAPPTLTGEGYRTRLMLQTPLRASYRRETLVVYGNVAPATHGETHSEVLGSGDGSKPLQRFDLRFSPLTYLAAPTPAGATSALEVRVNGVLWHEAERLAGLGPTDRRYIVQTDDEQKSTLIFGNGEYGARLPSGAENVQAVYRNGIGKAGNVIPERITLLATRPFGVKAVTNPLPATGGADRESRDQARRNAPLAVMALDRLVSVQDYADFARTYAGIGKAAATTLSDGAQRLVHLTIAGADDIPIDPTSDLFRNLVLSLRQNGDPYQPFVVAVRELVALFVRARVRIDRDYRWEDVEPRIRSTLIDEFSFDIRELGQDVTLGEVYANIQSVEGVEHVDVDLLAGIPEREARDGALLSARLISLGSSPVRQRLTVEMARQIEQITVEEGGETLRSIATRYSAELGPIAALATAGGDPLTLLISLNSSIPDPDTVLAVGTPISLPRLLLPAQLAYLPPEVPELLDLELLP